MSSSQDIRVVIFEEAGDGGVEFFSLKHFTHIFSVGTLRGPVPRLQSFHWRILCL